MRPARIELQIEELLLEGLPRSDRSSIARAIEAELSRLLAIRGLPSALALDKAIEGIDSEALPGKAGGAENIGASIARSIYHGIARQR